MSFLHQAPVFLAAAVVAVPLFKKLGLGSGLGYLAAGMVIGPRGMKATSERLLLSVYPHHKDEKKLAELAAQARKELESLFEQDAQQKAS